MSITENFLVNTKNFESIIEELRSVKDLPGQVNNVFLEKLGYSNPSDLLVLHLFKDLEMLDQNNAPTPLFEKFRDDSTSDEAMAEGITNAYTDLFKTNPQVYTLQKDDLKEEFKKFFGSSKSDLILKYMANTFLTLVNYAGLKTVEKVAGQAIDDSESDSDAKDGGQSVAQVSEHQNNGSHKPPTVDSDEEVAVAEADDQEIRKEEKGKAAIEDFFPEPIEKHRKKDADADAEEDEDKKKVETEVEVEVDVDVEADTGIDVEAEVEVEDEADEAGADVTDETPEKEEEEEENKEDEIIDVVAETETEENDVMQQIEKKKKEIEARRKEREKERKEQEQAKAEKAEKETKKSEEFEDVFEMNETETKAEAEAEEPESNQADTDTDVEEEQPEEKAAAEAEAEVKAEESKSKSENDDTMSDPFGFEESTEEPEKQVMEEVAVPEKTGKKKGSTEFVDKAFIKKAELLYKMEKYEEALPAYKSIIDRYSDSDDTSFEEHVTKAVIRRAGILGELERFDEAIPAYDDVIERFENSDNPEFYNYASEALVKKIEIMEMLDLTDELFPLYSKLVARLGDSENPRFVSHVDKAYVKVAKMKLDSGEPDKALKAINGVINRFEESDRENEFLEQAMYQKAELLEQLGQNEEALEAYESFLSRFGSDS